jgi:hypothetical protein
MYQVSRDQLKVHSSALNPLRARLNLGLSPVKQWRTIVNASAMMENRDAAVSCVSVAQSAAGSQHVTMADLPHPDEGPWDWLAVMG